MKVVLIRLGTFMSVSLAAAVAFGQWVQMTPQCSAIVLSVAQRDSEVFAGMNQGLFISHNSGESWTSSTLTNTAVRALLLTGTRTIAGTDSGIFISTDDGSTWSRGGMADTSISSLCMSGTLVFAGTRSEGVFISADDGTTWNPTALADRAIYALASFGTKVFASINPASLYVSADSGKTWQVSDSGLISGGVGPILVDSSQIYVGANGGVFESVDSGRTWAATSSSWSFSAVASLARSGGNLIAGTYSDGAKYSTDGGSTWHSTSLSSWSNPWSSTTSQIVTLADSGSSIFAGTVGTGIFRSTDNGETWTGQGLNSTAVNSLFPDGSFLFEATYGGVFRSSDYGQTWSSTGVGLNWPGVYSLAANDSGIYAAVLSDYGGLYRSTNDGDSWSLTALGGRQIYCVAASDSLILAGGPAGVTYNGGLFISRNNGNSWTMPIDRGQLGINSVAIGDTNLFATDLNNQGIFVSTNEGQTWSSQNGGSCMAVIGRAVYVAAFYNSVGFLSRDNGKTWAQEASPGDVYSLAVSHDTLYAATDHGIFASADSGVTWGDVSTGVGHTPLHSIAVSGGYIFAGSATGLVWRRPLSQIVIVPLVAPSPVSPANESTIYADTVTCSWTSVPGATAYRVQVAYDSAFQNLFFDSNIGTGTAVRLTGLDNGATYYWRVMCYESQLPSSWSDAWMFHALADTSHQGKSWSLTGVLGSSVRALAANDSVIIAGTDGGGIFRSTDDGNTWTLADSGLTCLRISCLAADGRDVFAGTFADSGGVFHSTDNGRSWSLTSLSGRQIYALAVSNRFLLAGGPAGVDYTGGLFVSTNEGTSWTQSINSGTSGVNSVALSDSDFFATDLNDQGIFVSTDDGTTWTSQFGGSSIAVIGRSLFVGAFYRAGGYLSTDDGETWAYVGGGGPITSTSALLVSGVPCSLPFLLLAFT